ncbi:ptenb protein [Coprinopsis sp. MPI-PUGE-AT-0042]|nr:ptenb protein [Coprinopsis sp. MPI-PUGE-AT-0042]
MTDFIRRLVSGPKARFQDDELGLDLDLVYVTDQVVIMGYPASGLEGLYRNRREDAKKFLEHRHSKNFWVFNFCPIRENSYESAVFDGRVSRFPFPDHHAPPLALLPLLSRQMHAWLDGHPDRVAVLHCKAGKGRSGTMACTYLLTLDVPATAPSLNRSLSVKERAQLHMEEAIKELPEDDHTLDETHHTPASHPKPVLKNIKPPSDSAGILDDGNTSPLQTSPLTAPSSNPERSFVDSLKGVLDLHTARRMKPSDEPKSPSEKQKKQKQGVSIPSQRRWLYYWALLLAGEAPPDVLNHVRTEEGAVKRSPKTNVRILGVQVRIRESSSMARGIVHATNVVLDKTGSMKSNDKGLPATGIKKDDPSQLWVSVARYDDGFVDIIEKWEAWTRSDEGGLAKRRPHSRQMQDGAVEHDLDELFSEEGKWDTNKMVRSFARFGLRGVKDEIVTAEEGDSKTKVHTYPLRLMNDKRWGELKNRAASQAKPSNAQSTTTSDAAKSDIGQLERDMQKLDIPLEEATSVYDGKEARDAASEEELAGLVVDASRELRMKLYVGKVFIGWFWFIPSFHMPQPPPTTEGRPRQTTATLHLTRKDIDFALGLGKGIIDVDVNMEWPTAFLDAALPVRAGTSAESVETAVTTNKLGAALQAASEGTDGIRDAVKAGQATGV